MRRTGFLIAAFLCGGFAAATQQPPAPAAPPTSGQGTAAPDRPTNLGSDPNGNPLRLALKTGHVSNYDEAKVRPYTLPDPLVLANGKPVRDAKTWRTVRRPEILRLVRVGDLRSNSRDRSKVTWQVAETDPKATEGTANMKRVIGTVGEGATAQQIKLTVFTPAAATKPVPIILLVNFGGGPPPPPPSAPSRPVPPDPAVAVEIIGRGWGYATVGYRISNPIARTR